MLTKYIAVIYVSQTIILYTLNLYSHECQLHLNKTGGANNIEF